MNSFLSLLRASLTEFRRDRTTFSFTIVLPLLLVAFFAFAYAGSSSRLSVGIVDSTQSIGTSQTPLIRELGALKSKGDVSIESGSFTRENDRLRNGTIDVVIRMRDDKTQFTYDKSDGQIAVAVRALAQYANDPPRGSAASIRASLDPVGGLANSRLDFVVPGVLATAIMWLGIFAAIPLVQQREEQVLRRFAVTPISRTKVVLAQVLSRLVVSLVQAAFILLAARIILGVPIGSGLGSVPAGIAAVVGLVLLGALAFVSLGYAIAAVSSTQSTAHAWAQLATMPMLVLAGVFFPISAMPRFLTPVAAILPLTYLADALRQATVDAPQFAPLSVDLLVLAGWTALSLVVAIRFFRWSR